MKHKIITTWAEAYKWNRMEQHLREASGSLNALHEYVLAKRDGKEPLREMTEGQFAEAYGHIYHHLNFTWNTRRMTDEVAEKGFRTNRKWPEDFNVFERDIVDSMRDWRKWFKTMILTMVAFAVVLTMKILENPARARWFWAHLMPN